MHAYRHGGPQNAMCTVRHTSTGMQPQAHKLRHACVCVDRPNLTGGPNADPIMPTKPTTCDNMNQFQGSRVPAARAIGVLPSPPEPPGDINQVPRRRSRRPHSKRSSPGLEHSRLHVSRGIQVHGATGRTHAPDDQARATDRGCGRARRGAGHARTASARPRPSRPERPARRRPTDRPTDRPARSDRGARRPRDERPTDRPTDRPSDRTWSTATVRHDSDNLVRVGRDSYEFCAAVPVPAAAADADGAIPWCSHCLHDRSQIEATGAHPE